MEIRTDCETGEIEELSVSPPPLEERRAGMRANVAARLKSIFDQGFTVPSGPLAGVTLQTSNVEHRTNWLTSQAAYSAAVAGGHGSVVGARFRDTENRSRWVSYADGLSALLAMAAWGAAAYGRSWDLKDAIDAAITPEALAAIDLETGWPGA